MYGKIGITVKIGHVFIKSNWGKFFIHKIEITIFL